MRYHTRADTGPIDPTLAHLPGFGAGAQRRHRRVTRVLLGFLAACGVLFVSMVIAGVIIAMTAPAPTTPITPAAGSGVAPSAGPLPTVALPPPPPDVAATTFSAGVYDVGTRSGQIAPGRYRTDDAGGSSYWARLRATDGETSSIIANAMVAGPTIITVRPGDAALELRGPDVWTKVG